MSFRMKRDLWKDAFDTLPEQDKSTLEFARAATQFDPKSLLDTVGSKRQECVSKQWNLYTRKDGEKAKVRDVFEKLSGWIDKFKDVGDVIVQYDPGHAALPWAAVRFCLQV